RQDAGAVGGEAHGVAIEVQATTLPPRAVATAVGQGAAAVERQEVEDSVQRAGADGHSRGAGADGDVESTVLRGANPGAGPCRRGRCVGRDGAEIARDMTDLAFNPAAGPCEGGSEGGRSGWQPSPPRPRTASLAHRDTLSCRPR